MGAEERPAPRVTIGISVYNAATTLPLALRSVFAQTLSDWELILVDDGSTDGSVELMRSVTDERVRVLVDGQNKTLAPRLNEIARAARAPLIARMDADDVMLPRRLEEQVDYLTSHPEVDVLGTALYSIDSEHRIQGMRGSGSLPPEASGFRIGMRGLLAHATVMGRTEWFLRNPYDESKEARRCEDAELWLRTYGSTTFAAIPEPLLFYLEDPAGAMRRLRSSNRSRIRILLRRPSSVPALGLATRLALVAAIALKMTIYEMLWVLGLGRQLGRRRNRSVDPVKAEAALAVLDRVSRQPVPGILDPLQQGA
jgi:glycosyltransferase involved in cell wall biosynthesis